MQSSMQVATLEHIGSHARFKDISNTTNNVSGGATSKLHPVTTTSKERKRQKAKDAYVNMPRDRKEALLKKQREYYHRRKDQAQLTTDVPQSAISITATGDIPINVQNKIF